MASDMINLLAGVSVPEEGGPAGGMDDGLYNHGMIDLT